MKKISLADLLVVLKQYKGQMDAWQRRLLFKSYNYRINSVQ